MAGLNAVIEDVAGQLRLFGRRSVPLDLVRRWWFRESDQALGATISASLVERNRRRLVGKKLVLVWRFADPSVTADEDTRILIGEPLLIGRKPFDDNPNVRAFCTELFSDLQSGQTLEGFLYLVPFDVDVAKMTTLADLELWGADRLQRGEVTR